MRIGIDYTAAVNQRAGIGRYTRELVAALLQQDQENDYVLLQPRGAGRLNGSWPVKVSARNLPLSEWGMTVLWHRLGIPLSLEFFTGRLDLFHSTDFVLPPLRCEKTIVTVHDLSFMRYPDCAEPNLVSYLNKVVPRSTRRARLILADSENTKRDVIELLDVPPVKVEVIYAGVSTRFAPVSDERLLSRIKEKYLITRPFLLYVGTLEPRKNLSRLVEAYSLLLQESKLNHELILAGRRGWLCDELFQLVVKLGMGERVRFLGFVPDDDLPTLLSAADIFVYPPLYEGFGLPPLEAMACGTPVVASSAPCLPEILGDAALFTDPFDTPSLAQAMHRALKEPELRQQMIEKGLKQVKGFSWSSSAKKLLQIYQRMGLE